MNLPWYNIFRKIANVNQVSYNWNGKLNLQSFLMFNFAIIPSLFVSWSRNSFK